MSDAGTTNLTIQAVTAVTYNSAWDIALAGTGTIGTSPVDLPFITSGSYSNGTITLSINGGLESDITITGIDGTDTFHHRWYLHSRNRCYCIRKK